MTIERWIEVNNGGDKLTEEEKAQGFHFCYEFDGLLVGPDMVEWKFCHCGFKPTPPVPKGS